MGTATHDGGLPDHIHVDVELRGPQDLQSAMYYARVFERRAVAIQQASPSRTAGSLPGPDSVQGRPAQASAAPLAATAARPFRRLTSAELLERRRQGLCFNYDEPYTPGHACPRLFYLEVADYNPEDEATWEQRDEFRQHYPDFQLEDELFAQVGRNVISGIYYSPSS